MDFHKHIRSIPDFPKKGILFRDMGPLMKDPTAWNHAIKKLGDSMDSIKPDLIAGIESRGFIVCSALAIYKNIGFIIIRKKGKLGGKTIGLNYSLEYGSDRLEIQKDCFPKNSKIFIGDDLLATGGTAKTSGDLVKKSGGIIVGYGFIIELKDLCGRNKLDNGIPIQSIITY